jgi:hypothetical protein
MRSRLTAAVVAVLVLVGPSARAQRVNKVPVRHVEAALILDSGVLRVRLTLATGEALDYDVRDDSAITRVLKFIEIAAGSRMSLAAEVATDGHTVRALHLVPEELAGGRR